MRDALEDPPSGLYLSFYLISHHSFCQSRLCSGPAEKKDNGKSGGPIPCERERKENC